MKNKIVCIFLCILLTTISISVSSDRIQYRHILINHLESVVDPPLDWFNNSDQNQTNDCTVGFYIIEPAILAQEFKPTMNNLTAVALCFFMMGSPPLGLEITVEIKDSLDGDILAEDTIKADNWRITGSGTWVLFDFNDITVTPEDTYYIICSGGGGDPRNNYCWYFGIENPYDRGIAYRSSDNGNSWNDLEEEYPTYPEIDLTFISYCGEPPDDSLRQIPKNRYEFYNQNSVSKINQNDNTKLEFMIAGDGLRCLRFYQIHLPPSYDGSESVPLVIALHGSTGAGRYFNPYQILWFYQDAFFEEYTALSEKADEENFIVVYPKALLFYTPEFMFYLFAYNVPVYPDSWYRGRNLIDDVGFIGDLIDSIQNDYNINSDMVYLSGFSNGADMVYTLGCLLSDKISAISAVAGEIAKKSPDEDEYSYPPDPTTPMPVIVFHGTGDVSCPYEGDQWGCGVDPTIQFWVEKNSCNLDPDIYVSESGNIISYTYSNGIDDSEVMLYKSVNGTHCWPGNDFDDISGAPWLIDRIKEISATDLMWDFFESHPKK